MIKHLFCIFGIIGFLEVNCYANEDPIFQFYVAGTEDRPGGMNRNCSWAARRRTKQRCAIEVVFWNCPITCTGTSNHDSDDTGESDELNNNDDNISQNQNKSVPQQQRGDSESIFPTWKGLIGILSFHAGFAALAILAYCFWKRRKSEEGCDEETPLEKHSPDQTSECSA